MKTKSLSGACLVLSVVLFARNSVAQSTFVTYQGNLDSGGVAVNGNHDFEFALFDSLSGGLQVSTTQTQLNVAVVSGIFAVQVDFGNNFPGSQRFLEIRVRPSGGGAFTTLSPRQPVTSSPYSIKSLNTDNAQQLGGIAANQFIVTTDPRLSDARNPLPGSSSYVQNAAVQQASANFNISGNGTAGGTLSGDIVNASTQYNAGASRVLTVAGVGNVFVGVGAGQTNSTGTDNSFVGRNAGLGNTSGVGNSIFGRSAGANNSTGSENAFFGRDAGTNNTTANDNAFFGSLAGRSNTTGFSNAFFGRLAGESNTTGANNSFAGFGSGENNTIGNSNSFFGRGAGSLNTSGSGNSMIGDSAGLNASTGIFNAFFGAQAGSANTSGSSNTFIGTFAGNSNATGGNNTVLGTDADVGSGALSFATAIGAGAVVSTSNTITLGRSSGADTVVAPGPMQVNTLGAVGATALCRNASNQISTCSLPRDAVDLTNAVREQQAQIEALKRQVDALTASLCMTDPKAAVCSH